MGWKGYGALPDNPFHPIVPGHETHLSHLVCLKNFSLSYAAAHQELKAN
jgi:hypothetical protein